jgi:hypothetical protein
LISSLQTTAIGLGGPIQHLDPQEAGNVMTAGENGGYARGWEVWKQQATSK